MESLRNDNAERAILLLLMKDSNLFAEVENKITAEDFYSISHQELFRGIAEMVESGENVDMVTLAEHLTHKGTIDKVGGLMVITSIYNGLATVSGLPQYVQSVKEMSRRRFLYKLSQDIKTSACDLTKEVLETEGKIVESLEQDNAQGAMVVEVKDSIVSAYEELMKDNNFGLLTRFFGIDQYTKGFAEGNLIFLAGRPAMGKTALALNILANVCKQGKSVLMLSMEMTKKDLNQRLICSTAHINKADIFKQKIFDKQTAEGDFSEEVKKSRSVLSGQFWNKLTETMDEIWKWKLGYIEKGRCSIRELRLAAKIRKKREGLDLIIIDYLQLMSADGYKDNRVGEISYITRQLKLLAQELQIPILVLSQLNRSVESRNDKRPTLSDLRESGSIEQDADQVFMLYRDSYYNEPADPWTELIIAKNRSGGVGRVKLDFNPQYTLFTDYNEAQPSGKVVGKG